MPFSTGLSTTLSNFEAGLNYKDVSDPSVMVSFPVIDDPLGTRLVAWTTTPWTLPSNLALCVHPEFNYLQVKDPASGTVYIVAESRLASLPGAVPKKAKGKGKGAPPRPPAACPRPPLPVPPSHACAMCHNVSHSIRLPLSAARGGAAIYGRRVAAAHVPKTCEVGPKPGACTRTGCAGTGGASEHDLIEQQRSSVSVLHLPITAARQVNPPYGYLHEPRAAPHLGAVMHDRCGYVFTLP